MQSNAILTVPDTTLRPNNLRSLRIVRPSGIIALEYLLVYFTLISINCSLHGDRCIPTDAAQAAAIFALITIPFLLFKWLALSRQVTRLSDPWISTRGSLLAIAGVSLACLFLSSHLSEFHGLEYVINPLSIALTAMTTIFLRSLQPLFFARKALKALSLDFAVSHWLAAVWIATKSLPTSALRARTPRCWVASSWTSRTCLRRAPTIRTID